MLRQRGRPGPTAELALEAEEGVPNHGEQEANVSQQLPTPSTVAPLSISLSLQFLGITLNPGSRSIALSQHILQSPGT